MGLIRTLTDWCERRGRVQNITGRNNNDIYMVRYILFRSNWMSIYIHQFLRSDHDSFHDHPWNFWTWIVHGRYTESRLVNKITDRENIRPGQLIAVGWKRSIHQKRLQFRRAEDFHYVTIDHTYSLEERHDAPTTICIIGRRRKTWGFIDETKMKWVFWKEYLGIPFTEADKMKPSNE